MELFHKAKAVRLRSHHDKYLTAEEEEESVTQARNGASKNARWSVEFLEIDDNIIRLKSCYGKYLMASNMPFLLGMTGRKLLQTAGRKDSSVEWEPIREGNQVKLRTRHGTFLQANGPPWPNSVTHNVPNRTAMQDWILWDVDVVEIPLLQLDNISGEEGWISLGPWGGEGGVHSEYKLDGPIMQITIRYGYVIESILFESKSREGVVIGSSVKIGGTGGTSSTKFCINSSVEQFSSVSLTYKDYDRSVVVTSLCFNTNLKKYGPFGSGGGHSVFIPIEGEVITGFHGRGERYLDAIGILVAPKVDSFPNSKINVNSLHSVEDPDSVPNELKGKISGDEGWISLGPWGGEGGVHSEYKPDGPIMQITIRHGYVIESILFESKSRDGVVVGSSVKIGGAGGRFSEKFCIDSSVEQFSSLSLTYNESEYYFGCVVVTSLCFNTNLKKYGPFGLEGGRSVFIPIEGEVIIGFHGRGDLYLDAIGIFVAPKVDSFPNSEINVNSLHSIEDPDSVPIQLKGKIIAEEGWISLGPWGGEGGGYITYKPDGPIMKITICYGAVIYSILFESKSRDGVVIGSSKKIGGASGSERAKFCIDSSVEQFSSISLTYDDYGRSVVVTSLCFNTNLKKYGPFGSGGRHSVSIPIEGGVIAGFHGRGGYYLHAIGIFVAPKVDGFFNSGKNIDSLHSNQDPNSAPTQLKGKTWGEEGCISLGPWGGNDGEAWGYKADGPIIQISVSYGKDINSILFQSRRSDGLLTGSSEKIGGTGGYAIEMFCIDTSEEQLSSISLTYEFFTITSLCIHTNLNTYGPFGSRSGASSVSIPIPIEGGVLTGFHGRTNDRYITAIGILVAPKVNSWHPIQDPDSVPTQLQVSGSGVGSNLKTLENIHNAASSSATTNKDDHHAGAPSSSSEMIRNDLFLVKSALKEYMDHMNVQINLASEKFEELQKSWSSERDFDELGIAIAKLKFQIPLTTNKDDHHGGALSPTSKKIRSDLILVDTAFVEAKESMYHMNVKINQAHEKFNDLQILPSSEIDSDELRKADFDKKRKANSDELRKAIAKLKVQIPSPNKFRSPHSNLHHKNWDNINGAEDGMMHFFHNEPEVAHSGDFDGRLKVFLELPEQLRGCLLCFFKFPPEATIKRTPMIYLWIGQGYISWLPKNNGYIWDVEVHASKIFDELIAKGFIEPIYQNYSLVPDSCRMSRPIRSSLYEEAKRRGFTSNGTLDLDPASVCGDIIRHSSCLINVGEAIINFPPEIFEDMKHIQSLYLGRWQSSATHHIELADSKILHGLNKLNKLTFLSLRGISMITELPTFISELNNLMILDLRACHNLEVIPDDIGLLKSLTHLDMSECYFLEHMPESLAHLSNLQVLKGFLIGDFDNNRQSCTLRDLSRLRELRKLNIYMSVKDHFRLQDLEYLKRFGGLKKLTISWGGCSLQARAEDIAKAFDNVTLPPRLQKLDLQCFPTKSLPDKWMMPGKHMELKKLYIRGGHLCYLQKIQEHQGDQWAVEILHMEYLSKLNIDWRRLRILFPKLIYLHQAECPKLTNFPCDEMGVWMDNKAINTHVQLQKYLKTSGRSCRMG